MFRRKELWTLWERLQQLREMDSRGYIECYICKEYNRYPSMVLKTVYFKVPLPLHFVKENNYFCCNDCNTRKNHYKAQKLKDKDLGYSLKERINKQPQFEYTEQDIQWAEKKLRRLLKNHDYERAKQ